MPHEVFLPPVSKDTYGEIHMMIYIAETMKVGTRKLMLEHLYKFISLWTWWHHDDNLGISIRSTKIH